MTADTTRTAWRWDRGGNGVWTLWFDQPGKAHNVFTAAAFDELDDRLAEVEADGSVRRVLVRSGKEAGFCAGADLRTFHQFRKAEDVEAFLRRGLAVFDRLCKLDAPTTAVLHGVCLGGGLELALACRHRVALASNVALQLGTPEVHFGLIPGWGGIERLTRLLAPKDALELLLYGDPIGFLLAKSQGAVDRLISQDESDRLADSIDLPCASERALTAEAWSDELEFARSKLAHARHEVEFPEAREAILDVIEIDVAEGAGAAREAAVGRMVELTLGEPSRRAIDEFVHRARTS
jgi:3-hydroxyacyl-CoA dehydrogenase/enoyl-CoA hydratase/3-hydroxybutyryl-CoA epimerase